MKLHLPAAALRAAVFHPPIDQVAPWTIDALGAECEPEGREAVGAQWCLARLCVPHSPRSLGVSGSESLVSTSPALEFGIQILCFPETSGYGRRAGRSMM